MMNTVASAVVWLVGLYLIALAVVILVSPARGTRFLGGFASSARVHYLELLLRTIVGASMLRHAPRMLFSTTFAISGWVLIITSAMLCAIPWQWHQQFARRAVPYATRSSALFAMGSLAFGAFVLFSVVAPDFAP